MSLTVRLSRIGRKNQPAYKLVVANTRSKRNGQFVDIIGHYNPYEPTDKFSYDKEKFEKWVKQGAFVTTAVSKLIDNKYEYVKYDPKKIKEQEEAVAKEKGAEKSVESKEVIGENEQVEETPKEVETTEETSKDQGKEGIVEEKEVSEDPKDGKEDNEPKEESESENSNDSEKPEEVVEEKEEK